jgi:hypothetical protein
MSAVAGTTMPYVAHGWHGCGGGHSMLAAASRANSKPAVTTTMNARIVNTHKLHDFNTRSSAAQRLQSTLPSSSSAA